MDHQQLMYLLAGGITTGLATYYLIRSLFPWLKYDMKFIRTMGAMGIKVKRLEAKNKLMIDLFENQVKRIPQKPFVIFEDQKYTYEYMNKQANKVAHIAQSIGLKKGDIVAMMQLNEPAFIWTFFGKFNGIECPNRTIFLMPTIPGVRILSNPCVCI